MHIYISNIKNSWYAKKNRGMCRIVIMVPIKCQYLSEGSIFRENMPSKRDYNQKSGRVWSDDGEGHKANPSSRLRWSGYWVSKDCFTWYIKWGGGCITHGTQTGSICLLPHCALLLYRTESLHPFGHGNNKLNARTASCRNQKVCCFANGTFSSKDKFAPWYAYAGTKGAGGGGDVGTAPNCSQPWCSKGSVHPPVIY
jgi:hypothetical protein